MTIDDLRKKIDKIDSNILELLKNRASLTMEIGKIKILNNLPVFNQERELKILQQIQLKNKSPLGNEAIKNIFKVIIYECRNLQTLNRINKSED